MLIIPFESSLDWRRPPVVTLILIIANCWIYFANVGPDSKHSQAAYRSYYHSNLVELEGAHYRAYAKQNSRLKDERLPRDDRKLIGYVVFDLGFDAYVASKIAASDHQTWRSDRNKFEDKRNAVTTVQWGLIPANNEPLTYLSSMFLHGSGGHLVGNMVFLFLFGFALERVLGVFKYVSVYLLGGICGGLLHVLIQSASFVPTIGASGAVSALMAAYVAVYQLRKIRFFYNFLFFFGEFTAPALVILPFWLGKELYGHFFEDTNVAYWVHIGGLIGGAVLAFASTKIGKVSDVEYLDERTTAQAELAQRLKLEKLVEEFKYDQAKPLAQRVLTDNPHDVETWRTLLMMVGPKGDTADADEEYHAVVAKLFGSASVACKDAQLGLLIDETYQQYSQAHHNKSALKKVSLLLGLAKLFAVQRNLEAAQKIANALLKANRKDPEMVGLLNQLSVGFHKAGAIKTAKYYRQQLKERFPAA